MIARRPEGADMEAKLFGSRLSPFVEKVARALQLKGIAFTLVPPKSPADFKRWNAQTRKMPVVEIDGRRVFDSTLILRRLDQLVPEPPLLDRDAGIAARQRLLEDWSDESLYWYAMPLRLSGANAPGGAAGRRAAAPGGLLPARGRRDGRAPCRAGPPRGSQRGPRDYCSWSLITRAVPRSARALDALRRPVVHSSTTGRAVRNAVFRVFPREEGFGFRLGLFVPVEGEHATRAMSRGPAHAMLSV